MPAKYFLTAVLKFFIVFVLVLVSTGLFTYAYFYTTKGRGPRIDSVEPYFKGSDLLILPYTTKSYSGYGRVFEPQISLKVKDAAEGTINIEFLLDSGAVVSTLPISYTEALGKDVSKARRIVLRGFGNQRSFGYMSTMELVIKNQVISVPVVFSEGELDKKILGRNGFFDKFTITFDHKEQVIRVRQ